MSVVTDNDYNFAFLILLAVHELLTREFQIFSPYFTHSLFESCNKLKEYWQRAVLLSTRVWARYNIQHTANLGENAYSVTVTKLSVQVNNVVLEDKSFSNNAKLNKIRSYYYRNKKKITSLLWFNLFQHLLVIMSFLICKWMSKT